jgi:uncharacterized membrane protein
MAEVKITKKPATATAKKSVVDHAPLFVKENYMLMIAGLVIIALGMFLMAGGKSADPKVFDVNQVYSKTRITVAPILIVLGFLVEIYAIFKGPKVSGE